MFQIDNNDDCDDDSESLETYKQKIDSTKDLLLIFTDRKTVKFTSRTTAKVETGRWCEICKSVAENWSTTAQDLPFCREKPPKGDIRNAFFLSGNSSCSHRKMQLTIQCSLALRLTSRVSKSSHGPVFCYFWPRPRLVKDFHHAKWARLGPVNRSCTRPVTTIGGRLVSTGLAQQHV